MCTVIARLAKGQLEMFGLNVAFPAIVTDCGANMRKAFNNTLSCTIQPKLRPENVNKRLTGEKCELLLSSALSFLEFVRNIWNRG